MTTLQIENFTLSSEMSSVGDVIDEEEIRISRTDTMKIVFMIFGAAGCPGNLFTIFVILNSPKMRRKPFNILIAHQSLIDLLVSHYVV